MAFVSPASRSRHLLPSNRCCNQAMDWSGLVRWALAYSIGLRFPLRKLARTLIALNLVRFADFFIIDVKVT